MRVWLIAIPFLVSSGIVRAQWISFVGASEDADVRILRFGEDVDEFSFQVSLRRGGGEAEWTFRNGMRDVTQATILHGRLVMLGEGNRTHLISIWNIEARQQIDLIRCFDPVISNTGRYVAFVGFYPRGFPPAIPRGYIYDLSASPEKNRVGDEPYDRSLIDSDGGNEGQAFDRVGVPVGVGIEGAEPYDIVRGSPGEFFAPGGFTWSKRDEFLAFLDTQHLVNKGTEIEQRLVVVDLRNGRSGGFVEQEVKLVDKTDLLLKGGRSTFKVFSSIKFVSDTRVRLTGGRWPTVWLEIDVPEWDNAQVGEFWSS